MSFDDEFDDLSDDFDSDDFDQYESKMVDGIIKVTKKAKLPEAEVAEQPTEKDPLTDEHKKWIDRLSETWKQKKPKVFSRLTQECFSSFTNPYFNFLQILTKIHGFRSCKGNSLHMHFAREFNTWCSQQGSDLALALDGTLQEQAIQVGSENCLLIPLLVESFCLGPPDNKWLVPSVRAVAQAHYYKEASEFIVTMDLHEEFGINEVCAVLLFQNKINVVEKYCARKPHIQHAFVSYLDSLFDPSNSLERAIAELQAPNIQQPKRKTVLKLATRFMKLYHLDPSDFENLYAKKGLGTLHFIMNKRFSENSISKETFKELVQSVIGNNKQLREEFFYLISVTADDEEVFYWADYFRIPRPERAPSSTCARNDDAEKVCKQYLELTLPREAIIFVDSQNSLERCLNYILEMRSVVAIDAEWRPQFAYASNNGIALLQMAVEDRVFLIDTINLRSHLHRVTELFTNPSITKIGYGVMSDLAVLSNISVECRRHVDQSTKLIDLLELSQLVMPQGDPASRQISSECQAASKDFLATELGDEGSIDDSDVLERDKSKGLSELCRRLLGHELDKREQMSDWERRPLRPEQAVYAALDAHCLLKIYPQLCEMANDKGIPVTFANTKDA